jgi:hypothetical protein
VRIGKASRDRATSRRRRLIVVGAFAIVLCFSLSSCGGDSTTKPQAYSVLTASELEKFPAGSAEDAFLGFWSALQFQAWADVASYYAPSFRDFIGIASLIEAKKINGSAYPLLKPVILGTNETENDTRTIDYSLYLPDGTLELASTTWREVDGNWQMIYDSRLDPELNQLAHNRVEISETGTTASSAAELPSVAATRAGNRAARLQAEFLEQELKREGEP